MNKSFNNPVIQETVKLPSRGLVNADLPESFSIRPMTVNELKMLYGTQNTMTALNQIIKSVVSVSDFPIDDLVSADKLYLAFVLRALTFGEEYKTSAYCTSCQKYKTISFNLISDLKIDYLPEGFKNPRTIGPMPASGDEIDIKLLTSRDFEKILNRVQKIKADFPEYQGDPLYPTTMASQIVAINGKKVMFRDAEDYVLSMHALDDNYFNKRLRDFDLGPKMPISVECPDCASEILVRINVSEDFFRPELDF